MTKLESGHASRPAAWLVAFTMFFAACGSPATDTTRPPASITPLSGGGQRGFTGLTLSQPLVVKVSAADGTPVAGVTVDFAVDSGQASVDPASATTDVGGMAQTQVSIGSDSGMVEIVATVRQTPLKTTFQASIQAIPANVACTTSNTVALAVGETRTSLAGSALCIRANAASEYMVSGFFASSVAAAQTQVGITGFSITTVGTSAVPGASVNRQGSAAVALSGAMDSARQLDLRLRRLERTVLAPRIGGARSAMRRRGALLASAPPTVGQILQFNVDEGCDSTPRYRFGRVAAITNSAIIVADTGNPAGGFTDADYQSVGVTFDTLVNPLDTAAFGAPTDIDGNGRIILFYTRAVNELTPANSQGIVEGFFNPRDLFPTTDPNPNNACSESNFAEMFYLIVPDPTGSINGNTRTKAQVQQLTIAVTAHEYQHLINAARRIYVNTAATDFEEVWLNEGLSHIAEELLYYRVTGLPPRQNIDGTTIAATQARANAFNAYAIANIDRFELFLGNPLTNSPYADNDSLATRGATWNFLRYEADHQGTNDGTVWRQLVNSTTTGLQNLTNVFGASIMDQFRNWSVSVYADDRAATSAAFQEPSWNFRSVEARLGVTTYPLQVFPLTNGAQSTHTLSGGGSLYTTLGVPANVTAAVGWSVTSPSVQISIVRTK